MQTYGLWHKTSMIGGAAMIMKDNHLLVIHGGCMQAYEVSALHMEVFACLQCIEWARVHYFHNANIYTNSCNLVQLLQGSIPLDIASISKIQEITYQALLFNWCCVKKVPMSKVRHAFNAVVAILSIKRAAPTVHNPCCPYPIPYYPQPPWP
ncbi:60S ribosomal protein L18a [Bienertia sinuspersici]